MSRMDKTMSNLQENLIDSPRYSGGLVLINFEREWQNLKS